MVPMIDIQVAAFEHPRPSLIGASDTHVWVKDGAEACAIALATGREARRVPGPVGEGARPVLRARNVMVLWREGHSVVGFDLETGQSRGRSR